MDEHQGGGVHESGVQQPLIFLGQGPVCGGYSGHYSMKTVGRLAGNLIKPYL